MTIKRKAEFNNSLEHTAQRSYDFLQYFYSFSFMIHWSCFDYTSIWGFHCYMCGTQLTRANVIDTKVWRMWRRRRILTLLLLWLPLRTIKRRKLRLIELYADVVNPWRIVPTYHINKDYAIDTEFTACVLPFTRHHSAT